MKPDTKGSEVVAANLRRLREHRGMTQEQLAEAAGLTRLAYGNIEKRKSVPRPQSLYALAAALKVKLGALVTPVSVLHRVRFRSLKRLNSREQVLADVARRLSDFNELEELLDEHKKRKKPPALNVRPSEQVPTPRNSPPHPFAVRTSG